MNSFGYVGSLLRHAGSFAAAHGLSSSGMRAYWFHGVWDFSSPTRDRTRVPCIARRVLSRCTTRQVPRSHSALRSPLSWALHSEPLTLPDPGCPDSLLQKVSGLSQKPDTHQLENNGRRKMNNVENNEKYPPESREGALRTRGGPVLSLGRKTQDRSSFRWCAFWSSRKVA